MSQIIGATSWMLALIFTIYTLGFWGIFFIFFLRILSPVAIIGALIKGRWDIALGLLVWLVSTFAMRLYGFWLASTCESENNGIVDVEYNVEPTDIPTSGDMYCPKCKKTYDKTWKICLSCTIPLKSTVASLSETIE